MCELALSDVRTPNVRDTDWREWLLHNAIEYRRALQNHPNLIPILMRRHPLRIGLAEHNATAGLLSVQGVPAGAIMPLVEGLEELALGSASYQSAVDKDEHRELWKERYSYLYHLSIKTTLTKDRIFELIARASIDAILAEVEAEASAKSKPRRRSKSPVRKNNREDAGHDQGVADP